MQFSILFPILLSVVALLPSSLAAQTKPPKNAILLSSVKSLTLRANAKTSHRRIPAIQQLVCKGPGCAHHKVDIMRCTNEGSDYETENVQWSCVANVPGEFKLGGTEVICEGYANRDDQYVLKGSCGVEYRLLLTDIGEEKYGNSYSRSGEEGGSVIGGLLFMAVFLGVAGWILYSIYLAYVQQRDRLQRQPGRPGGAGGWGGWGGGGWGGGGGGGGGWNDPPPPYPGKNTYPGQQGYRPGFWTGALGGAAAGYMAGNLGNRQAPVQNSWLGGANNGGGGPRQSSPRSTTSSTTYESTGFGSTSRR